MAVSAIFFSSCGVSLESEYEWSVASIIVVVSVVVVVVSGSSTAISLSSTTWVISTDSISLILELLAMGLSFSGGIEMWFSGALGDKDCAVSVGAFEIVGADGGGFTICAHEVLKGLEATVVSTDF